MSPDMLYKIAKFHEIPGVAVTGLSNWWRCGVIFPKNEQDPKIIVELV